MFPCRAEIFLVASYLRRIDSDGFVVAAVANALCKSNLTETTTQRNATNTNTKTTNDGDNDNDNDDDDDDDASIYV